MRIRAVVIACALAVLGPVAAFAQSVGDISAIDSSGNADTGLGRSNAIIGLGIGLSPDYEGSENYEFGLAPFGRFSYQEYQQYLLLAPNPGSRTYQARLNILAYEGLEAGPMVAYRAGRKHVDNHDVNRLPNIDNAWEAGGFARYWIPLSSGASRPALSLDLSGAADVTNAYDGWWIQPGFGYRVNASETVSFSARLFADYASADYMDEFFSISAAQSAASGLRQYDADADFKDVGLTLGVIWLFADHWFTGATGTYERMLNDAGSSPVTRNAGNKNQGMGGVFVGYRF